jgi:hypothetical protein
MAILLGFTFHNQSGTQSFVVKDLVVGSQIWTGAIVGNGVSPLLRCAAAEHGPGWGRVSVVGSDPPPLEPMVKDIRFDGDEFVYVP